MKELYFNTVLVLGAHADDEFGCSGTIIRLLEGRSNVHYAVFSTCEESVPRGYPKDILFHELHRATRAVGLSENRLFIYNYQVRHFPSRRQEILEDMIQLRDKLNPDLILLPASTDIHQDHHVIAQEGLRAFKFGSILGYELPMNTIAFNHACFIELSRNHVEGKINALRFYESQQFRSYANAEFIWGLARIRGIQAGVEYAEAFEVVRVRF